MEYYTPSFQEGRLMTCLRFGYPFHVQPYTTLNEKLNIAVNEAIAPNQYPITSLFTIGTGGRKLTLTSTKLEKNIHAESDPTNTALFEHVPLVLRDLDNDLTTVERQQYRLRRLEAHAGTTKIAYYAKKLIPISAATKDEIRTTVNGTTTPVSFIPTVDKLSPLAAYSNTSGVTLTKNSTVVSVGVFNILIDAFGLEELRNVSNILYGDPDGLIISEIGLTMGVDRTITVAQPNFSVTYTESIASIISGFLKTKYEIAYGRTFNEEISLGSDSPLP